MLYVIYDPETIEAHAVKPAPDWTTCVCQSCEKRRDLRAIADMMIDREEDEYDDDLP